MGGFKNLCRLAKCLHSVFNVKPLVGCFSDCENFADGSVAALSWGPVSAVTFASCWHGWAGLGWAGWCRYLQETRSSAEHCSILEWRPLPAGLTLGGESHSTAAGGWSPHCSGLTLSPHPVVMMEVALCLQKFNRLDWIYWIHWIN